MTSLRHDDRPHDDLSRVQRMVGGSPYFEAIPVYDERPRCGASDGPPVDVPYPPFVAGGVEYPGGVRIKTGYLCDALTVGGRHKGDHHNSRYDVTWKQRLRTPRDVAWAQLYGSRTDARRDFATITPREGGGDA